ncbi:MAG: ribosome maturation factor RimM [Steroidobacterales bacterium]
MTWVELGRLGAPYGVKGWVHVESFTDPPDRLLEYRNWVVRMPSGERTTRRVAEGRMHGSGLAARLDGSSDRNAAAALTGAVVEIERAALPPTGEREFYRADLIGFGVHNLEGASLGNVSHFVDTLSGAVMVAKEADGREHWVLASPPHLHKVDLAARRIEVDWPKELAESAP